MSSGVAPGTLNTGTSICAPRTLSCSTAAGRCMSAATSMRLFALLLQPARELRARRRLARPLQAHHHDAGDLRPWGPSGSRRPRRAHERDHLVVADLHEDVAGRHLDGLAILTLGADTDDLAQRLLLHARQERLDDAELDVGLEQRQAHLAQGRVDVLLGQLGQTGEAVARGLEAFGEGVEHGWVTQRISTARRRLHRYPAHAPAASHAEVDVQIGQLRVAGLHLRPAIGEQALGLVELAGQRLSLG